MASESENVFCDEKLQLVHIRDLPMNVTFSKKNIEDTLDYMPKDDDIVICSYPKTGTTWMQYIVWKILHKSEALPSLQDMASIHVPFMERVGTKPVECLGVPRVYRHHFPYNSTKINNKAKYIYTYRNPMDTVVSYYHFTRTPKNNDVDFDYFFEKFLIGKVCYGDYFDHVLQFYEHRNEQHLLLVSYEDLQRDKKKQILRIAKFLGHKYYQELLNNEDVLQNVMNSTEFNYMKNHIDSSRIVEKEGQILKEDTNMFRKGIVGDGKNSMKPEQIAQLNNKILEKMKGTEFEISWRTYK